ncbi:MAG: S8 family serine peptidase [Bacilli bacterium]|nr:S8 family serine peptidase [Bacilli bacterium]
MKNFLVTLIVFSLLSSANLHIEKKTNRINNDYEACLKAETPEKSMLDAQHVPGELIVTVDAKTSRDVICGTKKSEELIEDFNCDEYECLSQELIDSRCSLSVNRDIHVSYLIRYEDKTDEHLYDALCNIKKNSSVDAVEPNYIRLSNSVDNPVDEYYSEQWGLRAINAPAVWHRYGTGSYEKTRIGILDDGVSPHEDLCIDASLSRDFSAGGDRYGIGHGTHVAGICGAIGDNTKIEGGVESGVGVVGVCQKATVVDLKVASKVWIKDNTIPAGGYYSDRSSDSTVLKAVNYAISKWETSQRISVLNYSYSGYSNKYVTLFGDFTVRNPVNRNILLSFRSFPGTVVWSAGNDGEARGDNGFRYCPNLISVGSIDETGEISGFSNWGPSVNIYAPGGNIFSTFRDNQYVAKNGTSMAAPFVSGVAAYLYSKFPGITARQVKDAIVESVNYEKVIHAGNGILEPIKKLDFLAAYNKAYGLFNETDNYPIKLEMLNCEGDKWKILIQNTGKSTLKIAYPESNCSEQDVTVFSSNNCKTLSLSGKSSKTIEITYDKNKGMCFPVGVYSNGVRKITYLYCSSVAWNVDTDFLLFDMNYTTSSVPGKHLNRAPQPGLDFEIKSSRINWFVRDWKITIKNNINVAVDVMYNSKMCFYGDGLDWKNLADVEQMSLSSYGTSSEIWINANGTADAIAMCLVYIDDYGLKRGYVSVANGIKDNGHGTLGHKTISL